MCSLNPIKAMLGLTSIYFVVELVVGLMLNSLTLKADAFHMLSDMVAMTIGLWAEVQAKKKESPKATFGYSRSTVVGGLINGALLLGIAFSIFTEAITRFFDPEKDLIKDESTSLLLWVAGGGLAINLIGLACLCSSSHHGHSHQDTNHNLKGVILHVIGDLLGSIAAMASALIMRYFESWDTRYYADPILSLIVVGLISASTFPIIKQTTHILLQKAPRGLNTETVKNEILGIQGILDVHHLHFWQHTDMKHIASLHVRADPEGVPNLGNLRETIQRILHAHGFHSSTVQFDFREDQCEIQCDAAHCQASRCCSHKIEEKGFE